MQKVIEKAKSLFIQKCDIVANTNANVSPGGYCSSNEECLSNICNGGVCFASNECKALKYDGGRFDANRVNLVFVGSGFESLDEWKLQASDTFSSFDEYNMFSSSNEFFNAFFVSMTVPSFCEFGCSGIDRLLCCDIKTAKGIAEKCIQSSPNQQIVVIHNDPKYGGAGYLESNMATMSVHQHGSLVAIHELGHSLFNLADEYSYGDGNAESPNCDTQSCSKWQDLMNKHFVASRYGNIGCIPGCQGNSFFIGQKSFMRDIKAPAGAVNERLTCCTYLALTGHYPSYCDLFNFNVNELENYCNNYYQDYTRPPPIDTSDLFEMPVQDYILLQNPMQFTVALEEDKPSIKNEFYNSPGIYSTRQLYGDFKNASQAFGMGVNRIVEITLTYDTGSTKTILFDVQRKIDIPPAELRPMSLIEEIEYNKHNNLIEKTFPDGVPYHIGILEFAVEDASTFSSISLRYIVPELI